MNGVRLPCGTHKQIINLVFMEVKIIRITNAEAPNNEIWRRVTFEINGVTATSISLTEREIMSKFNLSAGQILDLKR
jgi:hypothetical protein